MRFVIFLVALLTTACPFANAQGSRLMVPNTLAGLEYPAGMLARGQGGTVLVQLQIDRRGAVERIVDVQASNGLAELEKAVRDAVGGWTFRRNTLRNCVTEGGEGVAQIEFQVREGKPFIQARGRPDVAARVAAFQPMPSGRGMEAVMRASYPTRAWKSGLGAAVTVSIDVEESTGYPVEARVPNIAFSKAPGYAEAQDEFTEAARGAVMRLRFEPGKGRQGDIFQACIVMQYVPE